MSRSRRLLAVLTAALSALAPVAAFCQDAPAPWPQESVQSAVASCRGAILDGAAKDYLARNHLGESQLPEGFREQVAPVIEPLLHTCDCSIAILSKEFSYEDFQANTPRVQERTAELVAKGGACAVESGT
jgi:hypothetical protein